MSLPKNDRNFRPESGNRFPTVPFATAVAAALHREYDHTGDGVARVVALTGANERTVRNWFEAKNGPGGDYLIALCRHSDEVLEIILTLAGRATLAKVASLEQVRRRLTEVRTLLVGLDLD
ncbi:MAG: hypothetical protein ABS36_05100 [Acidobacteria bacterium SCN 69-37]|nr:MAG: hypothetical protein ABS36_05100 [Acidobacteria bacterium SCN 69-37]